MNDPVRNVGHAHRDLQRISRADDDVTASLQVVPKLQRNGDANRFPIDQNSDLLGGNACVFGNGLNERFDQRVLIFVGGNACRKRGGHNGLLVSLAQLLREKFPERSGHDLRACHRLGGHGIIQQLYLLVYLVEVLPGKEYVGFGIPRNFDALALLVAVFVGIIDAHNGACKLVLGNFVI